MRIVVVEDEIKMAGLIRRGRGDEGLAADIAWDYDYENRGYRLCADAAQAHYSHRGA